MSEKKVKLQAHRGVSCEYPENTLAAFSAAIDEGYAYIEADCKFTADDVCIMLHDDTLNRTCRNDSGSAFDRVVRADCIEYNTLADVDAGVFMGEKFRGTRIPTLAQTLELVKGKDIKLKLDNVFQSFNERQFEIFCDTIKNANMQEQIAFTCKTIPYLDYLSAFFPASEMHYDGMLTDNALEHVASKAGDRLTVWVPFDNEHTKWCHGKKADADFCNELHMFGNVGIWLITDKKDLIVAANDFSADVVETDGRLKPADTADV